MMNHSTTADRDLDTALLHAKTEVRDRYRGNTPDLLAALDRVRQEYLANAPAWNFVLGNLIDENKNLRATCKTQRWFGAVGILLFVVAILIVVAWAFRNGGTRYVPFPVDRNTGATVSDPVRISGWVPAGEAEQIRVVRRLVADLFRADIHHQTNEDRWGDAQAFLAPTGLQDVVLYRSQQRGAYDPFVIGASGRYCDVTITRLQPHYTLGGPSMYEVDWDEHYTTYQNRDLGVVHRTAEFIVTSNKDAATLANPQGVQITKFHPGLAGANP